MARRPRSPGLRGAVPSGPAATPGRTGRGLIAAGLVLLLAGLAVAAALGWQLVGTTWVAHRRYDDQVSALRKAWSSPPPRAASTVDRGHGTVVGIVSIPAIGLSDVPLLEGTSDDALASGLGHFAGTAAPGGRGNLVLGGHRITHGEPLRRLPDLEPGDEVIIETRAATYTYVLDTPGDGLAVGYDEGWVLADRPAAPRTGRGDPGPRPARTARLLTLVTCAELFHTDERLVVFGHLVGAASAG